MSQKEVGRPLYVTKENRRVVSEPTRSTIHSYLAEMAFFRKLPPQNLSMRFARIIIVAVSYTHLRAHET